MAWEQRKNTSGRYYYRSKRLPDGRVVKTYFGAGLRGAQAADADRVKRTEQSLQVTRHCDVPNYIQRVAAPLVEMCEQYDVITAATLLAASFHCRKGEWRKRRHGWHSNSD